MLDGDFTATFAEHRDRVLSAGRRHGRRAAASGRGDRFAVMALNGHQFLELYHASFLGGSVINPLNLRLAADGAGFIIKDSGLAGLLHRRFLRPLIEPVRAEAGIDQWS